MRVVIADDRPRSRKGLKTLLATYAGVQVVGEAANGQEAVELVAARLPDVVLMDVRMPTMDGVAATRLIKENWPQTRVVLLTMYGSHRVAAQDAGADAFLIKGCSAEELLGAIALGYDGHNAA